MDLELKRLGIPKTYEPPAPEEKLTEAEIQEKKLMDGLGTWVSYWRANPHRFVSEYLQLKPFSWFQKILLFMMFKSSYFMWFASRGLGKTYLTSLYCVVRSILWPESHICVAAGIKAQAMEIITSKIADFKLNNPMIASEISEFRPNIQDAKVGFHNGSWIRIVAANDNARGIRANVIVVDEFRMVNEDIIKTVLTKFLTASRRPQFVNKVLPDGTMPYANYEEPNTQIYLSSMWLKSHWSWERFQVYTDAMLKGRPYFTCALPYQLGIREGIIMRDLILNEMKESDFNEQLFKMEMETIPFGESEKAFFRFDILDKTRKNDLPIIPMTTEQFIEWKENPKKLPDFNRRKRGRDIRILSMDVSIMASSSKKNNDATVFTVITGKQEGNEYLKTVDYIESIDGTVASRQAITAKRLFYDLECDYFVVDAAGCGQSVVDSCLERTYDHERNYEYPAWTFCEYDEDLMARCKESEAVPVIYPIKVAGYYATQMNHDMALYTRAQFINNKIKLLVSEAQASEILMEMIEYRKLSAEEQVRVRTPYIQTTFLINEMINLESDIKGGYIKLTEPTNRARKDRYSSLAYGLYFLKYKEQDLKNDDSGRDNLDLFLSYCIT